MRISPLTISTVHPITSIIYPCVPETEWEHHKLYHPPCLHLTVHLCNVPWEGREHPKLYHPTPPVHLIPMYHEKERTEWEHPWTHVRPPLMRMCHMSCENGLLVWCSLDTRTFTPNVYASYVIRKWTLGLVRFGHTYVHPKCIRVT